MRIDPPTYAAPAPRRVAVVIDHDESVRELLADVLRQAGFAVTSAPDGTAGIEAVARHEPTLITLEMDLPSRDGVSLVGEIRRLTVAPIIMISDHGDEIDVVRSLSAGADTYVVKPFRLREFRARVEALMRRPEQASALHAAEAADQRDPAAGDGADNDWVATAMASLGPPDELTPGGSDVAGNDWVATAMAALGVDDLTPAEPEGAVDQVEAEDSRWPADAEPVLPADPAAPFWAPEETAQAQPDERPLETLRPAERGTVFASEPVNPFPGASAEPGAPEVEHPLQAEADLAAPDPTASETAGDGPEPLDHVEPQAVRPSEGWEDFRGLAVNRAHRLIEVDHRPIEASAAQFDALAAILTTGRGLRSRVDLAAVISGRSAAQVTAEERVHVDAEMADLFDKLGESREAPRWIDVIPGVGYRRIAL